MGYSGLCVKCSSGSKEVWKKRRAVFHYDDRMAILVHEFKFKNNIALLKYFSRIFYEKYFEFFEHDEIDYVIPVPLSKKRARERGYNQVEILASLLPNVEKDILFRKKDSVPLSTVKNTELRKKLVKNAFEVDEKKVAGKKILLVDDLITTGATSNEIVSLLKNRGAKSVMLYALILARG